MVDEVRHTTKARAGLPSMVTRAVWLVSTGSTAPRDFDKFDMLPC